MEQLIVINQLDLLAFGCPNCGCIKGGTFLSFGSWSLWGCETCAAEIAVVEKSICELSDIEIRDTDIRDLIGKHPYSDKREFDDRIVISRLPPLSLHTLITFELELAWEKSRN